MLDVELSRSSWKGREGQTVRQHVGRYAKLESDTILQRCVRILRACPGKCIYADMVGRAVARHRHVFSPNPRLRLKTSEGLLECFEFMQSQGWGCVQQAPNGWPVFVKSDWVELTPAAKKALEKADVPVFTFVAFPPVLTKQPANSAACQQSALGSNETPPDRPAAGPSVSSQAAGAGQCNSVTKNNVGDDERMDSEEEDEDQDATAQDLGPYEQYCSVEVSNIESYVACRKAVEAALGERKDPGVYHWHDQKRQKKRVLFARCKPSACLQCTRHVRAELTGSLLSQCLTIHVKGKHGNLAKPDGGALWNVAEQYAIQKHCRMMQELCSKGVTRALKLEGMALRCTARQLSNWVYSERKAKGLVSSKPKQGVRILEVEAETKKWLLSGAWAHMPLEKLVVFEDYIISDTQVFVAWSTRGMLERAKSAENKVVKFVVDGKQKVAANQYTVLTLSFLISNEKISRPRSKRASVTEEVHCSTQEPFMQALVDSESTLNLTKLFKLAICVGQEECNLDLSHQVRQVHKDYARGIEAARRDCFPSSRPCDDYAHMRRATYKVLESMLCKPTVPRP